jgi:hypothetical protein
MNQIGSFMPEKILLIIPPLPLLSVPLSGQQSTTLDLSLLQKQLQESGYIVEVLDARTAGLNLFQILRRTHRFAPHYVMMLQAGSAESVAISLLVSAALMSAMPFLKVFDVVVNGVAKAAKDAATGLCAALLKHMHSRP